MNAWGWIVGYVVLAIVCFALLVFAGAVISRALRAAPPAPTRLFDRIGVIVASLLLIALVAYDFQQRAQTAQIAGADRETPDEATARGELIDGPAVVGAYFRQGYTWAEAHAVNRPDMCPSDNRAYRDGCRAFADTSR